jgi:transcription termination/antitermination protein NusA
VLDTKTANMFDPLEAEISSDTPRRRWSALSEANFDAKRRELGVADELKEIPGVTTLMLVEFGEQGIKSIEDLASCATDDLYGWIEEGTGTVRKHEGILHRFWVSRRECDAMILHARTKAGWIKSV